MMRYLMPLAIFMVLAVFFTGWVDIKPSASAFTAD